MRIDLGLQRTQLHAGAQILLTLELEARQLRGDQLGKARGERGLTRIDVAVARIVQLEGPHAAIAHDERGRDSSLQAREEIRLIGTGCLARENLHALILDDAQRALQNDRRTRGAAV